MGFYPVVLELAGRAVLVVGGGPIAERKVFGLLEAGARVTVVSPIVSENLQAWARERQIRWIAREFRSRDTMGYALVFAATQSGGVNAEVAGEARAHGIWVNAADEPVHCDFILPSVLRRGELTVAVSTGGASPSLSRLVREELEAYFSEDYRVLAGVASEVRRELGGRADGQAWRLALEEVRGLIASGQREEAKTQLRERLRQ